MKGQAEATEVFMLVSLAILMVVMILLIWPLSQSISKVITTASAELVAKDLAGLTTISAAAPGNISISYEVEAGSINFNVDMKDRVVNVNMLDGGKAVQTSSSKIAIDIESHLLATKYFMIEKTREA